jgi:GTP-binding protein Era
VGRADNVDVLEAELRKAMEERGIRLHAVHRISALKGNRVAPLMKDTWQLVPAGPLYYPDEDQLSDRPTRFFVAEKVREQLFRQLGDELPYSCAVEIERFDEKAKPLRIEAVIHVERDSQKGMVVGKGGAKIKSIGQHARRQIEQFLGQPIFLGLRVKVLKDWTRDAETLKRMGYTLPK